MPVSEQERAEITQRLERAEAILDQLQQVPWSERARYLDDYLAVVIERTRLHERLGDAVNEWPA
jgi:hypothetical protein